MCVQNKRGLLFSLLSHFCNTKNLCSKQAAKRGGLLLVFIKQSLLSYFCNTKNICSKQAGNWFLVYSATFSIQNMCAQIKREGRFLVYSVTFVIRNMCVQNMCVQNRWEAAF